MTAIRAIFHNWLVFYLLIVLSWSAILVMGLAESFSGEFIAMQIVIEICSNSVLSLNIYGLFIMWFLMSIAMMAPTIIPTLTTYQDLLNTGARKKNSFWTFVLGFMSIWFFFSLIGSICQKLLAKSYLLDESGAFLSSTVSAVFLLVAGLYQLSPLKEACLTKCRSPFTFFLQNWKEGVVGSFSMGLKLGIFCLGCCWALMSLAFVGGTMNLVFMVLMTLFMILEKLPNFGKYITKPLSFFLIASATVLVWL